MMNHRGNGLSRRRTWICVTQMVGQRLQFISREANFIEKDMVQRRLVHSLKSIVRVQVEVVLIGMNDLCIDDCANIHVAGLIAAFIVDEEPCVVPFFHNDECQKWVFGFATIHTVECCANGANLMIDHFAELTIVDT